MNVRHCLRHVRHFQRKIQKQLLCVVLLIAIYFYLNLQQYSWYVRDIKSKCNIPQHEMHELKSLIRDTHKVLQEFHLTHFLVYGSLWGALRMKDVLPWDSDVDMGLMADEINHIDEQELIDRFASKNISIYYRLWLGSYRIDRNGARGDLMVFQKTFFSSISRSGLERWILFPHHVKYHRFPARLLKKPLPVSAFAGVEISVPREGNEVQKYTYPNDWWKESKPVGC